MTTRIGLLSDLHATPGPVAEALAIFRRQNVQSVFCMGDIAGYGEQLDETVDLLVGSGCRAILGNHDIWYLEDAADRQLEDRVSRFFGELPLVRDVTVDGKRLYIVHASPPESVMDGVRLLDQNGCLLPDEKSYWTKQLQGFDSDVLVVGHTHQVFSEQLGDTLVVNPGSTKFNHSCAVLSLPELSCEVFPLSGQTPVKSWNWGSSLARNFLKGGRDIPPR